MSVPEYDGATETREFREGQVTRPSELPRRDFVKLLGASAALAGMSACMSAPEEEILPYVHAPPNLPGVPVHYATAMSLDGFATGLLVESHDGRPTKIEGNPEHPASLGAAGIFEQASVLGLYDPHRLKSPRLASRMPDRPWIDSRPSSWRQFEHAFDNASLSRRVGNRGEGLMMILEPTASPLTAAMLTRVRERFPECRIHFHSLAGNTQQSKASLRAFGEVLLPQYDFRNADVVVSLGADPFGWGPFHLRHARDFSDRRRRSHRVKLYCAETCPSPTSTLADDRIAVTPRGIARLVGGLHDSIRERTQSKTQVSERSQNNNVNRPAFDNRFALTEREQSWINRISHALFGAPQNSIVVVDEYQSESVQLLVHAINSELGNIGSKVWYTRSPIVEAGSPSHEMASLNEALGSGEIDTLLVLNGNPAYSLPPNTDFATRSRDIRNSVYLGQFDNETARVSTWQLPAAHYLEEWGIECAYNGAQSIVQPLIAPMYGGRTSAELLAFIAGVSTGRAKSATESEAETASLGQINSYELVREQFINTTDLRATGISEASWRDAVRRGVVEGSALPRANVALRQSEVVSAHDSLQRELARETRVHVERNRGVANGIADIELSLQLSRTVHDGRFGDNAWLQELPDPITKLTWGNAALLSPLCAAQWHLENGDVARVKSEFGSVELPVLIVPGHADESVTLALGYGRDGSEAIARAVGVNANVLRSSTSGMNDSTVTVRTVGKRVELAVTQRHSLVEGRGESILGRAKNTSDGASGIDSAGIDSAGIDSAGVDPAGVATSTGDSFPPLAAKRRSGRRPLTLYEPPTVVESGAAADQWAMTIDLDQCTGCSACVVACQSENNIPVVGKEDVLKGREMHWIRIDRYISDQNASRIDVQPMLCQHCEKAPCEYVCPVNATVHSEDGLNEMVYNRCVGTRFCSNNCPYKVRRFNWYEYNGGVSEPEAMQKNPDVTVRARGVMEKCTFCIQRIRRAQRDAELAGEPYTGPVQTACQQTCPSQAIVFGSLTSRDSEVAALSELPRAFSALEELGTIPRVRYLSKVTSEEV